MRLSAMVIEAVKKAGIEVYYADRTTTKVWNSKRIKGEPIQFGGWYWHRVKKGRVVDTDENDVPFRTRSAAIRDAFVKLQLKR